MLALSYSSRWELVRAARFLAAEVAEKHLLPEDINEDSISSVLTTADIPDPDLLIRTGGEYRRSRTSDGIRSRSPMAESRTLFFIKSGVSCSMAMTINVIKALTSASEKSVNNYDANIHL